MLFFNLSQFISKHLENHYIISTIEREGNDYRSVASYICQLGIPLRRYYRCPLNCEAMAGQSTENCPNRQTCRTAFSSRLERILIAVYE
ncbi:MAG: hypothetical protein HC820_00860 [Hydrococcus sp. RM1_1_31]|nr:hypothetical protein [Hydrococcus sp. RM1_1_31]